MAIPTHKLVFTSKYKLNIPLRLFPTPQSDPVGYMSPSNVELMREWVNGVGPLNGDYNLIKVSDSDKIEGQGLFYYVPTETVELCLLTNQGF